MREFDGATFIQFFAILFDISDIFIEFSCHCATFFKDNRICYFEVNVRNSTICQKDEKIGMEKKASSIDLDFTVQIRKSRETFSVNGAHTY